MKAAQLTGEHMKAARRLVERLRDDGKLTDPEQALTVALAASIAEHERAKALQAYSASGQRLADGTVIRARREPDGKLVVSQTLPNDVERVLLTVGGAR